MVTDAVDTRFMARALFLAERGRGATSPNPVVGAVVVSEGVVVGQGAHLRAGGPHAEVVALDAAGARARGATLYCTLEPCCHTGRTGPCVERIIPAGITRVVAAMPDPNPRVAGQGFTRLRAAGIEVLSGVMEESARGLNRAFESWVTRGRPFVIAKAAVSADGLVGATDRRIALSCAATDRFFHRQRAEVDAIAVGATTVLVDDPRLTARLVWRPRPLVRVVFDWRLRVPAGARVFSTRSEGPVIMATGRAAVAAHPAAVAALERAGAEVVPFETRDLSAPLAWLGGREITSLLVEGGPALHDAFFRGGLVDRVQRIETAHELGRGIAVSGGFTPAPGVAQRIRVLGSDRLVEWDVHGTD